jgi:hypothetical protein
MEFNFAALNNEPEAQRNMSVELTKILSSALIEKDNISSIDRTLTTRTYEKKEVNAFYIQSNVPGNHIPINAGGEVYGCSAIIHLFGPKNSREFNFLKKHLEETSRRYKPY